MTSRERLNAIEIKDALRHLSGWTLNESGTALEKRFVFSDFNAAFAFMTRAAMAAERMNHHPDWSNVYNRVTVSLSTHDRGGVTELDIRLATLMDRFAG